MMKRFLFSLSLLLLCPFLKAQSSSNHTYLPLQAKKQYKKWSISLGHDIGYFNGIIRNLRLKLSQQGFNTGHIPYFLEPYGNRIYPLTDYTYPIHSGDIELAYHLNPRIEIGHAFAIFQNGETKGTKSLNIRHKTLALEPFIRFFTKNHRLQFKVGAGANFFQTARISGGHKTDQHTQFIPGLLLESSVSLIENERVFLRILAQAGFAGVVEIGPYNYTEPAYTFPTGPTTFRQTKHRHTFFSLGLRFGLKM